MQRTAAVNAVTHDTHAARQRRLIIDRLRGSAPPADVDAVIAASSFNTLVRAHLPADPKAAAVLVPIVDRADELTVLLTQRSTQLRHHAGQISFPGGRIEATDANAYQAALREAHEEIGLAAERVTLAGYLPPQLVISGYWVTPVVGLVRPGFALQLDASEVASVFEVPLSYILDRQNHRPRERVLGTTAVLMHDITFGPYRIWGATAAMLIELCRVLNADDIR